MRLILIILLISAVSPAFTQQTPEAALKHFVNDPSFTNASISIEFRDVATNTVLLQHNPFLSLPTASTAKLFATASALELLGGDYAPVTRIYHDGAISSEGVLKGNLWIRGGGDPSLGSKYFNQEGKESDFLVTWVTAIREAGINTIEGKVIADASEFGYHGVPDGWSWSDMGNYYGAGPSGLCIYDNMIRYRFAVPSTSGQLTKLIAIEPNLPYLNFENEIRASERQGDHAYIYGAPFSNERFGIGTLPAGTNYTVKGSMPDPERFFAEEMIRFLEKSGIEVLGSFATGRTMKLNSSDQSYGQRKLIHSHRGASIRDLVKETNFRSINLFAEQLVCLIGYVKKGKGETDTGLQVISAYWGDMFNTKGLTLNDGSGLSRSNGIAANHFIGLLSQMKKSKHWDDFSYSLPVSGTSGTMINVCNAQAAHGKIAAKSGSMNRIRSYAGYLKMKSGKEVAFAVTVNNATCSNSVLMEKLEALFNVIAQN